MEKTSSDNPTLPIEDRRAASQAGAGGGIEPGAPSRSEQMKAEARDVAHTASREARGLVEQQKGAVAASLSTVARALRSTASQLESDDEKSYAGYASSVASSIDRFSSSIRDRDFDSLRRDADNFARTRPALFLGGCVALGFAISRFLKASGSRGTESFSSSGSGESDERARLGAEPDISSTSPSSMTSSTTSVTTSTTTTSPASSSAGGIESTGDIGAGGMGTTYFPEEQEP